MANSCVTTSCGINQFGCPDASTGTCPDFRIKRHDTKPSLEVSVKDCNEPIDLTDTVLEVSMWATGKFRRAVAETDTYFALADNIGFQQSLVGDIIVVSDQVRAPEQMLVTGFDEENKLVRVQREYNGTRSWPYKKGTAIQIFRFMNSVGSTEMVLTDILQVDGSTEEDVLTESKLIYEWAAQDTCLPGCYYLELKLLKMLLLNGSASLLPSMHLVSPNITPSFVSPSAAELCCELGEGVEWVRRFPIDRGGFLIDIVDSPTSECLA
jgi:hypothetical protein